MKYTRAREALLDVVPELCDDGALEVKAKVGYAMWGHLPSLLLYLSPSRLFFFFFLVSPQHQKANLAYTSHGIGSVFHKCVWQWPLSGGSRIFYPPPPPKKWRMCGAEMVRWSDAPFGYQAAWTHARTHRHSRTHKGLFEGDAVYLDQSRDLNFLSHGELIILQRQGIQFRLFVHGFFVVTLKRAMVAHLLKARS